jgi:hypothetical protein
MPALLSFGNLVLMMGKQVRELDHRAGDGLEVSLRWDAETNVVSVFVLDTSNGVEFELAVPASEAMEAFHHPFAYAASGGAPKPGSRPTRRLGGPVA